MVALCDTESYTSHPKAHTQPPPIYMDAAAAVGLHELRRATTNYHGILFANIKRKAEELATTAPTGRAEGDEHHRRGSEVEL